jgi:hypothetical protein
MVRYSDILQNQLKPTLRRKRRGLSSSGASAAWQRLTSYSPSYRETDSGFNTGGVTPSAIFTGFCIQWFSPLLVPTRRSTWMSLQIGWRGKGRGAWLAGTETERLLLSGNSCLSGTLEEVCRTWCGLHWTFMSVYHIWFCYKSLCLIFPVFVWMTLAFSWILINTFVRGFAAFSNVLSTSVDVKTQKRRCNVCRLLTAFRFCIPSQYVQVCLCNFTSLVYCEANEGYEWNIHSEV